MAEEVFKVSLIDGEPWIFYLTDKFFIEAVAVIGGPLSQHPNA